MIGYVPIFIWSVFILFFLSSVSYFSLQRSRNNALASLEQVKLSFAALSEEAFFKQSKLWGAFNQLATMAHPFESRALLQQIYAAIPTENFNESQKTRLEKFVLLINSYQGERKSYNALIAQYPSKLVAGIFQFKAI